MLVEFSNKLKKLPPEAILSITKIIEDVIQEFEKEYADVIKQQDLLFANQTKKDFFKNLNYRLYLQGVTGIAKTIVAKVGFPFYTGDKISKKHINVFLGTTKKYPDGLDDKQLIKDAPKIIQKYFENKIPDFNINLDLIDEYKKELILYRYWKEKIKELQLRTNPIYNITTSTNANNVNSYIANVKWGYPTLTSREPKKYMTTYLGTVNSYQGKPEPEDVKDIIKSHIQKRAPFVNDIPIV